MSKFNQRGSTAAVPNTTNRAGAPAFQLTPAKELATILLTNFVKDEYYRTEKELTARICELAKVVPLDFATKAAVYARRVAGMRSVSHILAGELAERLKGTGHGVMFYAAMLERPDDIMEIVSYRMAARSAANARAALTHALRKGFRLGFRKFDAYQLGKYQQKTHSLSLRDIVNLIHPRPLRSMAKVDREQLIKALIVKKEFALTKPNTPARTAELQPIIDRLNAARQYEAESVPTIEIPAIEALMLGLLQAETYQKDLVQAGQAAAAARSEGATEKEVAEVQEKMNAAAWDKFLNNPATPYFALLRNLRNIADQAPNLVELACGKLTDKKSIKGALVMPFRFLTAQGEIEKMPSSPARRAFQIAIAQALEVSFDNIPNLEGETLVALDISGSMSGNIQKIAGLFAAAFVKNSNADLIRFHNTAAYFDGFNPADSIPSIAKMISASTGGTSLSEVFRTANKAYDRIVIFSDDEAWSGGSSNGAFLDYQKRHKCRPYVYGWNLKGYGTTTLPEQRVTVLGGFQSDLLALIGNETSPDALIAEIEKINLADFVGKRPKTKFKVVGGEK